MTALAIIAKEPVPGRVKTRLHPALSYEQAAAFALASIEDTVRVVVSAPADRRILFFDGENVPACARGFELIHQPDGDLDERLATLFDTIDEPLLLVGMDTPQLTLDDLGPAVGGWPDAVDAYFGPANDGGFWALGMREPRGDLIRGVPMSRDDTGAIQWQRLADAALRTAMLPRLTDVDTFADAIEVTGRAPRTRAAAAMARFSMVLA